MAEDEKAYATYYMNTADIQKLRDYKEETKISMGHVISQGLKLYFEKEEAKNKKE